MKLDWKVAYQSVFRTIKSIEESPFIRLFAICAILLFPYQFYIDRSSRIEEGIARAWQIVSTPSPGNSGKVAALEYLARQGQSLRGIDLSCKAMSALSGLADQPASACAPLTYLVGLDLSYENVGQIVDLTEANLSGVNLLGANLDSVDLRFTNFDYSNLGNVNFNRANIGRSSFIDASFMAPEGTASFRGTHVSRANFLNTNRNIQNFDLSEAFISHRSVENYLGDKGPGFSCRSEDWTEFEPLTPPYPSTEKRLEIMNLRCKKLDDLK